MFSFISDKAKKRRPSTNTVTDAIEASPVDLAGDLQQQTVSAKSREALILENAALSTRLGELEAELKAGRDFAVLFLAFTGRDRNTSRIDGTLESLRKVAVDVDVAASRLLSSPEGKENSPAQVQSNGPEIATSGDEAGDRGPTREAGK